MSSSCASDQVYHVIAKKCVPKSSESGKILSNPKNKRCKDNKVVNPKTNHCADPKGATMRPILMKGEKADKKENKKEKQPTPTTELDLMMQYWKKNAHKGVFPTRKIYHDAKEDRDVIVNGLIAIYRLFKIWEKKEMKTNIQVQKAKQHFDMMQEFAKRFPKFISSSQRVTKSFSNIQRMEFEEPSVASFNDFKVIFPILLEKLLHHNIAPNVSKKDAKKMAWDAQYIQASNSDAVTLNY